MNKLFYGDNLDVMRKFIRDETVDLCYIDPPFNSKRNYNQIYNNIGTEDRAQAQAFTDTWTWDDYANQCYEEILSNKNGEDARRKYVQTNRKPHDVSLDGCGINSCNFSLFPARA